MMEHSKLNLLVRTYAAEVLGLDVAEVTEDTDLSAEFGVDSLELLEIGARVERALNVRIKIEDIVQAKTVGDAVWLLGARLAGAPDSTGAGSDCDDGTARTTG